MKKYDRNKGGALYSVAEDILDAISGIAKTASDAINGYTEMGGNSSAPLVDYNKIADEMAKNKVSWMSIIMKYIGCAACFYISIMLLALSFSLPSVLFIIALAVSGCLWGGGIGLLVSANRSRTLKKLIKAYIPAIGMRPEASVSYLSYTLKKSVSKVKKEIGLLLRNKVFPSEAYFDKKLDILVVDGYIPEKGDSVDEAANKNKFDEWINKLEILNIEILNAEVSGYLDELSAVLKKIREYVKLHPESEKKLRMFFNYYLPTTVKLTESYKTIETLDLTGENIDDTKEKITKTLKSLVVAYEKQLSSLYEPEAIDISAEVDVLNNIMDKE